MADRIVLGTMGPLLQVGDCGATRPQSPSGSQTSTAANLQMGEGGQPRFRSAASVDRIVVAVLVVLTSASRSARSELRPDFTLIALPDTQNYSKSYPQTFIAQTRWVVDQRQARNIVFVSHLGDIVYNVDQTQQWLNANTALSVFDSLPDLPLGLCLGNHDQNSDPDATTAFNTYFPYTRYQNRPWCGGYYGNDNDNSYQLFSAAGMDFVVVHLEYDSSPEQEVLAWADSILKTHSHRRAIVSNHSILSKTVPHTFSSEGQEIYDALKGNPNLFLMLCGHCSDIQEGRRADTYDGRTVYSLLSDYQDRSQGGNGWLRIVRFRPDYNEIKVYTYSPTLDQYETDDNSQFVLAYDMAGLQTVKPDFDRDGDVDMTDFGRLQSCLQGPYDPLPEDCIPADVNSDGHVNQNDLAALLRCLSGEGVLAQQGCDVLQ
jgi:hypothetical protein